MGRDTFVISAWVGAGNADRIVDFRPADDTVGINVALLPGMVAGALAGSPFVANAAGLATTASHRIIYETGRGAVSHDPDGTGGAGALRVLTLTAGLTILSAADFLLV